MRDELQMTDEERHSHFHHGNDNYISVDELWQIWVESEGKQCHTNHPLSTASEYLVSLQPFDSSSLCNFGVLSYYYFVALKD